ncbi:hypothetical protein OG417_07825 [Actinoallomurus sp. NBC_01490]|uniref:hypothetical protein n=1 Tax=Actinoallomurus sp. NBC_01490 TaxID=2903557 RepID=UPI002E3394E6|nr:hypothetical protein [Actinoallomurus sp. NBC_01490]
MSMPEDHERLTRTLRLSNLSLVRRDGEVEDIIFDPYFTLIRGGRNSGKTTLLRWIDYILGASQSRLPVERFGSSVVSSYIYGSLRLSIVDPREDEPEEHEILRALEDLPDLPRQSRVQVDGEELTLPKLASRLMEFLDWPTLRIPKGRNARRATELVTLSFRNMLRHLYRREDSWQVFASKEEEYHRKAVLAFFLGFAESLYSGEEFEAGAAARKVVELESRLQEITVQSQRMLDAVTERAHLPKTTLEQIDERRIEIAERRKELTRRRKEVSSGVNRTEGFHPELGELYAGINSRLRQKRARREEIRSALANYHESLEFVEAEVSRLQRAGAALALFSEVPVNECPSCQQSVVAKQDRIDPGHCFLCEQPVEPDARRRRIELEERALATETEDLEDVISKTLAELNEIDDDISRTERSAQDLARRLNQERASTLSPFVAELESLAGEVSYLEQQEAALLAVSDALRAREHQKRLLKAAQQDLVEAETRAQNHHGVSKKEITRRCSLFAHHMTTFLRSLKTDPWRFGDVTLIADDLTFYVGEGPWESELGGESKVLFLFAYQYAILAMTRELGEISRVPGFVLLDNPIQQGLRDDVVGEVMDKFGHAARDLGVQIVATVARDIPVTAPRNEIAMSGQFGGGRMS